MRTIECGNCLRYRGDLTCDAYPNGIPEKILTGQSTHTRPQPGDQGKTFFPIPGEPLQKADGPFMGPRGGKYEDAALTIPWKEKKKKRPAKKKKDESVQELEARLKEQYGVQLWLGDRGESISLDKIIVPKEKRGTGVGSKVMQELADYADRKGLIISASPSSDFGGSKKKIIAFNKKFGFIENKGRKKDYRFQHTMVRYPKEFQKGERISPHQGAFSSPAGNRAPPAGGGSGANFVFPTPEHKSTLEVDTRGSLRPALNEYSDGKSARGIYRDKASYDVPNAKDAVEARPVILAIPIEIVEGSRDDVEYRRARVEQEGERRSRKLEPNRRPVSLEDIERKKKRKGKTDGTVRSAEGRAEVKERD